MCTKHKCTCDCSSEKTLLEQIMNLTSNLSNWKRSTGTTFINELNGTGSYAGISIVFPYDANYGSYYLIKKRSGGGYTVFDSRVMNSLIIAPTDREILKKIVVNIYKIYNLPVDF